jgi:hypothetical protein
VEIEPFAFSLSDDGNQDGSVQMRFEGFRPTSGRRVMKKQRAKDFIRSFLAAQSDRKAGAKAIHSYVVAQGISQRTSEAALKEMRSSGEVAPQEEAGVHQLVRP